MMTAAMPAQEPGPLDALFAALRAGVAALAGIAVLLAVALAAVTAAVVGVLIAFAAVALRLRPRRRARVQGAETLEGRRTAAGWVVEVSPR